MSARGTDDASLIDATRAGDLAAYGELYGRHVDACRRLARRLSRNRYSADDIVSDVFANTLNAIRNGHGPVDDFAPYVLRSVRHQAGRVSARGDRAASVDPSTLDVSMAPDDHGTEDQLVMTQAFGRLPERFRRVLWDAEVEGRSHAEIGARLGLREPAVAALARRARQAFCRAYLDVRANRSTSRPECGEVRSLLASHVRGTVGRRNGDRLDAHLETCAECAAVHADMARLDVSLRSVLWPASGSGLVGVSRWATLVERGSLLAGLGDLPALVATAAVGLTVVVVGPIAHDGDPVDHGADVRHRPTSVLTESATAASTVVAVAGASGRSPSATTPPVAPQATPPATSEPGATPPVSGPPLEPGALTPPPTIGDDADAEDPIDGGAVAPDAGSSDATGSAGAPAAPVHDMPDAAGAGASGVHVDLLGDDGVSVGLLGDEVMSVGLGGAPVLDVAVGGDDLVAIDVGGSELASVTLVGDGGLASATIAGDLAAVSVAGPDAVASVSVGGDTAAATVLGTDAIADVDVAGIATITIGSEDSPLGGSLLGIDLGGLLGS